MAPLAAALLLPFTLSIGIWVAWSDMKFMKIPNTAVLTLAAVWLVVGLAVNPFSMWTTGLALGAILLVIGFFAATVGFVGAGDAKFIAAMAPFFVQSNPRFVLVLAAAVLLGAFAAHRLGGKIPALRAQVPDWESWVRADFPMGLALAGILNIYMLFVALPLVLA
ncbi:MAG: prepilin peptidase [Cypionkella sp.]|nr:prepilin peptidase [Cypionkella sp.]